VQGEGKGCDYATRSLTMNRPDITREVLWLHERDNMQDDKSAWSSAQRFNNSASSYSLCRSSGSSMLLFYTSSS
jgi:hypothetical protein